MRESTHRDLLQLCREAVAEQEYRQLDHVVWPNRTQVPPDSPKYLPHATARNRFVDQFLTDKHEYVWWVDADIVAIGRDVLGALVAEAERREQHAILAPAVYVEMIHAGEVNIHNGGWFYDIGGFTTGPGNWLSMWEGLDKFSDDYEFCSVGVCSLVPAWLYRAGLRYAPHGPEVEHVSFCRQARDQYGVKSLAMKRLRAEHAYLPRYGETWH